MFFAVLARLCGGSADKRKQIAYEALLWWPVNEGSAQIKKSDAQRYIKLLRSIYKCPGCSLRTCSLACVNYHKQRTACSGKRPLTNFIPISKFDDNLLLSDYNMLEDVKQIADSAPRMIVTVKLTDYSIL
ncbi:HIT-type Zinc finger family protein [Perilla frutescens var. hirtella]|uniref:HIT-type Zinc finger family protein n=1 Tax=Perilla frutescens var. hirtella TaxID=608512 RepID=A0AAD4ISA3_PERFH|nr:HIT-type Zinc finger family protein [Perilla frutescens var. hirtella]